MAERARTACYERRIMYLEHSIRRLLTRAGVLGANNKRISRCRSCRACSDLALSPCRTTDQRRLLSGRDLDNKTTSRVAPGTPRDTPIRSRSLQAPLRAREGGLKSLDVPWVMGVDPAAGGSGRGPGNGPFGSRREGFCRSQISTRRGVPFHFFRPLGGASAAPPPGEVSSKEAP